MPAKYQPVPPGYQLFDGTIVNVIIDALNAQATAFPLAASYQLPRHLDGFREMTGDSFNRMDITVRALGLTSPLSLPGGLTQGHRLFTGDLLNKFAKAAGVA